MVDLRCQTIGRSFLIRRVECSLILQDELAIEHVLHRVVHQRCVLLVGVGLILVHQYLIDCDVGLHLDVVTGAVLVLVVISAQLSRVRLV